MIKHILYFIYKLLNFFKRKEEIVKFTKQTKQVETEDNMETPEVKPDLKHTALGTFMLSNGNWVVAQVKYDPETKVAEVVETKDVGQWKSEAAHLFKVLAAELDLV